MSKLTCIVIAVGAALSVSSVTFASTCSTTDATSARKCLNNLATSEVSAADKRFQGNYNSDYNHQKLGIGGASNPFFPHGNNNPGSHDNTSPHAHYPTAGQKGGNFHNNANNNTSSNSSIHWF